MNRKLVTTVVMSALTLSATSVFASPITFSGDGYLQYNNTVQAPGVSSSYNGIDSRFRLNVDGTIDDTLRAHLRLVQEGDLSTTYASGKQLRFDEAYLASKLGSVDIQVGKSDLFTGKGLLIDDHEFSGIKAKTTIDDFKLGGFYGKSSDGTKTATMDIGTTLGNVNFGANSVMYGTDHFYGVNADTKLGNTVLNTEYVKNTSGEKGYIVGATMGSYTVSYRNIEAGAVIASHSTNSNYDDSKGFRLSAHYGLTPNSSVTLYQDFTKNQAGVEKHRTNIEYDFGF